MPPSAKQILGHVRGLTDHVAVAVSCGKDSTAVLALCREAFPRVSAYFGYYVPGLSFQDRYLAYLERRFAVQIRRVPHYDLGLWIRGGFCRPITTASLKVPVLRSAEWLTWIREQLGAEWIALGGKAADNVHRNGRMQRCGGIDAARHECFPVAFWKDRAVLAFLKSRGLALPPDYRYGGESFRLQSVPCLRAIREHYPDDWRKILEVFPLVEARIVQADLAAAASAGTVCDGGTPALGAEARSLQPRTIDAHGRKKLDHLVHHHGLVEPLVWNRRTGNLVSGHQRIGILDADATKKNITDYTLTLSVVDLNEREEKKLNIALNNVAAQGSYDLEELERLCAEIGATEIDDAGFDAAELATLLDSPTFTLPGEVAADAAVAPITEQLQQIREKTKAAHKKRQAAAAEQQDAEFYLVLVFQSRAECERFTEAVGEQTTLRYLNGRAVASRLGIELDVKQSEAALAGVKRQGSRIGESPADRADKPAGV